MTTVATCATCKADLPSWWSHKRRTCSSACGKAYQAEYNRTYQRAIAAKKKQQYARRHQLAVARPNHDVRQCRQCSASLAGMRSHAAFCSRDCKTAHRDVCQKEKRAELREARKRASREATRHQDRIRYAVAPDYRHSKQRRAQMYYEANADAVNERRKRLMTAEKSAARRRQSGYLTQMAILRGVSDVDNARDD